ncbi:MAG: amidase family protein [Betaproteobacteria bacterium]|nr:amidase family protein [Betaproteobacteria bacterium]
MEPCFLNAAAAAVRIREKSLTSEALVRSCLERIAERDAEVRAWTHIDPEYAIAQARELDKRPVAGPLHGLPFGVKDMIDTADMPTTYNSPLYQGHRPAKDAGCVAVVRQCGALILGKTDTVEFAAGGRKALTRNPHNLAHTPGGSSSGSGAAVASYMTPLAFGTQTGGSHIRPASFNGIYGLKPTWGAVTREGAKLLCATCDTIGWFGRSVADLALVAEAFRLRDLAAQNPVSVKSLKVAVCRTPYWKQAEPPARQALATAAERLQKAGAQIQELELPARFGSLDEAQRTLTYGEGGPAFLPELLMHGDRLHPEFREMADNQRAVTGAMMVEAYDLAADCRKTFDALFNGFDVVLTPSAPGEAPEGLHTTGDWVFNGMWTVMHVPCLAIPCITGPKQLPVGVQIVGPRYSDARLLEIAAVVAPVIDIGAGQRDASAAG